MLFSYKPLTEPDPSQFSMIVRYFNKNAGQVDESMGGWRIEVPNATDGTIIFDWVPPP